MTLVIEDDFAAVGFQAKGQLLHAGQGAAYGILPAMGAVEQQEAASPGARYLAAQGAGLSGRLIGVVENAVADLAGELLLQLPALVQQLAER